MPFIYGIRHNYTIINLKNHMSRINKNLEIEYILKHKKRFNGRVYACRDFGTFIFMGKNELFLEKRKHGRINLVSTIDFFETF